MRLTAHTRIIGTLAVALIAAALAPGASANYGVTHQEAARSLGTGANPRSVAILAQQSGQSASSTTVVRPNLDQQITQPGSVGPPILPVVRTPELAAINRVHEQREAARFYRLPQDAPYSSAAFNAYATLAHPVAVSTPTVKAPDDGFDYGAAAIGAGLAAAIVVAITAGGLAVRRRRRPQYS